MEVTGNTEGEWGTVPTLKGLISNGNDRQTEALKPLYQPSQKGCMCKENLRQSILPRRSGRLLGRGETFSSIGPCINHFILLSIQGLYLLLLSFLGISLTHPVGVLCFRKKFKNIFICHLRNVFIRRKSSSLWQEWLFQRIKSEIISPALILLTVPATWLPLFHHYSFFPPLSFSLSLTLPFKAFLHSHNHLTTQLFW